MDIFRPFIFEFFYKKNKKFFKKFSQQFIFCSFYFLKDKENILFSADNNNIKYKFFNNSNEEFENFINLNFYLVAYFAFDVNKFLIKTAGKIKENCEIYFEDEFNERIYNLFCLKKIIGNDNDNDNDSSNKEILLNIFSEYNGYFHNLIKESFTEDVNLFSDFAQNFYSNIDKHTNKFKEMFKILMVFVFEINLVI